MSKTKSCKFLISGDVGGNFEQLFKRVTVVHEKKGPFDFLLCVGSFFGVKDRQWEHYIEKGLGIPLTVYILGPNNEDERIFYPEDLYKPYEFNSKVIYLGKRGIYTTCDGLRIGFLSGMEKKQKEDTLSDWVFGETDVKYLLPKNSHIDPPVVDIFMTAVWPKEIPEKHFDKHELRKTSKLLAPALVGLQPWYHFAGTENKFYERSPYSNKNSNGELSSATRFLGLGKVTGKEKWLHALVMNIPKEFTKAELEALSKCMTPSPFAKDPPQEINSIRYDIHSRNNREKRPRNQNESHKKMKIDAEKDCWFCLSSGKAENHLIIAIGKHAYLALNRGGLMKKHLNIFPVEHVASISQASEEILRDVVKIRSLIKDYFEKIGCAVIFYERYYKTFHSQIHCVPIPPELANAAEKLFIERVDSLEVIEYDVYDDSRELLKYPPEQNYFHVLFPNGHNLIAKIDNRFPLNFAREVLVDKSLLNIPDKIDWRTCVVPVEEEMSRVKVLRENIVYE